MGLRHVCLAALLFINLSAAMACSLVMALQRRSKAGRRGTRVFNQLYRADTFPNNVRYPQTCGANCTTATPSHVPAQAKRLRDVLTKLVKATCPPPKREPKMISAVDSLLGIGRMAASDGDTAVRLFGFWKQKLLTADGPTAKRFAG